MKIIIGCDHAGLELKLELLPLLTDMGIDFSDIGADCAGSVDYPDFGEKVSEAVSSGKADRGILICGTGVGMSIVANRFDNVRASLTHSVDVAKKTREHNDSNVLSLAGRFLTEDEAKDAVQRWLAALHDVAERHAKRHRMLDELA